MELKLYNTLNKQKEEFKPIDKKEITIYTCGPTVYSYAHIGNMRAYLFMDILRRVLKYNGYNLKHVMNITDVGHLESDADTGEDKMAKAAKKENKDPYEIAKIYTDAFLKDLKKLNIDMPEMVVKATDNIKEMEEYVLKILENGFAYKTDDTVYFDTSKLSKYGKLSGISVENQLAGARVDFDKRKKGPIDFALWIKAPENHIMKWDSFFGKSYPGWHIECSAMSRKYLGEVIDIHTGGVDHIPVHHENEIAQSEGFNGKMPANYWMHTEFLLMDGGKMSKSLGNLYLVKDLEEKGYTPLVYKIFNYTSHYRNKLNFTWEGMNSAKISLQRLQDGFRKHKQGLEKIDEENLSMYREKFSTAINDDLNMPVAMSIIWDIIKKDKKSKQYSNLLLEFDKVLGLELSSISVEENLEIPIEVQNLLDKRKLARENKDFLESDRLRDEIKTLGYMVKDNKDKMELEKIE